VRPSTPHGSPTSSAGISGYGLGHLASTQVSRLQGCLGQHEAVDWYNGVPSFEYRHVDVFVYWSVGAAKASLHHDPRNPGLATLIRTKMSRITGIPQV
jgi:hypothetical protein